MSQRTISRKRLNSQRVGPRQDEPTRAGHVSALVGSPGCPLDELRQLPGPTAGQWLFHDLTLCRLRQQVLTTYGEQAAATEVDKPRRCAWAFAPP